ncbi:MAG: hypothetical protein HYY16_06025 [Planctomycetes bacterium]|nr:hypothetical protein [Planctomycetota bacterium]
MHRFFCFAIGFAAVGCHATNPAHEPDGMTVDFRFSPPRWNTAICLPDDWQKTIVNEQGILLYDYPGPYFDHKICVQLTTDAPPRRASAAYNPLRRETFCTPSASSTAGVDDVWEAVDGRLEPESRWTCWDSRRPSDWFQVEWVRTRTIEKLVLHVYDDGGGVQPPASFELQARNAAGRWDTIAVPSRTLTAGRNEISFAAVETDAVRVLFTHRPGAYTGLVEFEAYPERSDLTEEEGRQNLPSLPVIEQRLESPRVPIVRTTFADDIRHETFAVVTNAPAAPTNAWRKDEDTCAGAWASPVAPADPAFADVAIGWGRPVEYALAVDKNGARQVALGLCEGYHDASGARLLELSVEGAASTNVDLLALGPKNRAHVFLFQARDANGDGRIDVRVKPAAGSPDPNAILNVMWLFPADLPVRAESVARGELNAQAEAYVPCLRRPGRIDALIAEFATDDAAPVLVVRSAEQALAVGAGGLDLGGRPFLRTRPPALSASRIHQGFALVYPRGTKRIEAAILRGPSDMPDLSAARERLARFYRESRLPWDRIVVPDAGVQALIDSSIRNIYQAREIVRGLPEYRVGPTVYRGLWVVDAAFIMEVVTLLGEAADARRCIQRLLEHQQPDGRIVALTLDYHKETGIAIWAVYRHARLTQDRAWLEGIWTHVARAVDGIKSLRKQASEDPKAPHFGLVPPGFSDGGIHGTNSEYTNVYWTAMGLRSAVDAAAWLGRRDEAEAWQAELDDFMATFRASAGRDMRTDRHGHRYLPILMRHDDARDLPQAAQWAFCQAIFPGRLFADGDPLVRGTMAMLDAANVEGLVLGTGWIRDGLWTYFGSFYAHAHLWLGHVRKAQEALYAFANHASPLLCWREEQMPRGRGTHTVGDMPHNWASAEFIRLVRHLIAMERGDRLDLLAGVPDHWFAPGARIALRDIATDFGRLTLEVKIANDGTRASIRVAPVGRRGDPGGPVLVLDGLRRAGFSGDARIEGRWGEELSAELRK